MARCSCGNATCSCVIQAEPDGGLTVTGDGSATRPYRIGQALGGNPLDNLVVIDSPTVDLTLTGAGTPGDKKRITAVATVDMNEIVGFNDAGPPLLGEVPTWNGSNWVFAAPAVPPGSVNSGAGLLGDGSVGNVLRLAPSGVWGTAPLDKFGVDTLAGQLVYVDSTGQVRGRPEEQTASQSALDANSSPGSWPVGPLILQVSTGEAATWPGAVSGTVHNLRRPGDSDADAVNHQWFYRATGAFASQRVHYRSSAGSPAVWSAWQIVSNGLNVPLLARGNTAFTLSGSVATTVAITFPVGLFSQPPTVLGMGRTSSGVFVYPSASLTKDGCTMTCRTMTGAAISLSASFDWIAAGI